MNTPTAPLASQDADIIIVGAGLVGASLACALPAQYRLCLIDIAPVEVRDSAPQYDDRAIALALGSQQYLKQWGFWDSLAPEAQAIQHVHVSEQGRWGSSALDSQDLQQNALGYVIAAKRLAALFQQQMLQREGVQIIAPAQITQIRNDAQQVRVQVQQGEEKTEIRGRLLIAADGGQSQVARQLHVPFDRHDYGQSAVLANVTLGQPHQSVAYERFTPNGPLALLPLQQQRSALVWTLSRPQARQKAALSDEDFLQQVQAQFGWRLGKLTAASRRGVQPLFLQMAKPTQLTRTLLLGNAAHSLHPVAGQGLNLGLRDVATLAEVLVRTPKDPGEALYLRRYQRQRQGDQRSTQWLTHNLLSVFSSQDPVLRWGRNLGLSALNHVPLARRVLMRQLAGLHTF